MKKSATWEATGSSDGQEIPGILWNPKAVLILSQTIQSITAHPI